MVVGMLLQDSRASGLMWGRHEGQVRRPAPRNDSAGWLEFHHQAFSLGLVMLPSISTLGDMVAETAIFLT